MNVAHHRTVELSAEKRALLDLLLESAGVAATDSSHILPRDSSGPAPLSFSQQRLWFLDQLVPGNAFYNISAALRLRTALSSAVLERSLNEIVRRHEALRTVFPTLEGQPVQQVCPELSVPLTLMDLRALPGTQREAEALRLATEEARRPFDLARGPLLRAGLLQLGAADYVFLLTLHHIVADGWSLGIFARELTALYAAFAAGRASPLAPLPIQYADFALWQRQWLQGEVLETQLSYWREQLKDLPVLQLPTDRRRPAVQTYRGAAHTLQLPKSLVGALKQLSQREGVTLFMTLLAAFKVLLHRYSGQDDIVTGVPVAGRNRAETEALIGFFVNTLVMRVDLSGDPTFCVLLARVRDVALGAYAHQDLPFEMLVEKLQPSRDLSRNPLFQVTFQLLNVPGAQQSSAGAAPMDVQRRMSLFDIAVNAVETEQGLTCAFEYDTDLFDAAGIERMAAHYGRLLEGIVARPDAPISALPLLSPAEREQLLVTWNATRADFPRHLCVHQLFEDAAARTPDAIALVCGPRRMAYVELNRRANQLARYLRGTGVQRGHLVAIHLERSCEMVIALLAVLKAGAAYVPLDIRYPPDRLRYMLEDTGAHVVLTRSTDQGSALTQSGHLLVCLDRDWAQIARECDDDPTSEAAPDDLAYVIYTSGSTGRPKGVMVPHRAIVNYLTWCTREYRIEEGSGSPVHSPLGFDLTVTSLFPPLLAGRTVWLLPDVDDIGALADALREGRDFSAVKITPAHLELLGQQLSPSDAAQSARAFVIGGEALASEGIAFWRKHAPRIRLINEYGPTETAVGCCVYELPETFAENGSIPIGRPIANTRLYVLDSRMQLVPVGVPGELYIGGEGVAHGYLNQPQATAEKFVADPFCGERGARMYRSGDLVRYRPDGNLEFLGRVDDQLKIRGFRIEPGEIEAVLGAHPGVQQAVVLAEEEAPRGKRLVAYVVPRAADITASALRAFLGSKLPSHMLPAAFVFIDALPLTANGKVDRRALHARSGERALAQGDYIAPRTKVEERITALWRDLLGAARVGVHDNFFELGGHSLLATQLVSRIREALNAELPLRALFETPTIAGLADAIATLLEARDGADRPVLQIAARARPDASRDIDRLSDAEVQTLLDELLADEK